MFGSGAAFLESGWAGLRLWPLLSLRDPGQRARCTHKVHMSPHHWCLCKSLSESTGSTLILFLVSGPEA